MCCTPHHTSSVKGTAKGCKLVAGAMCDTSQPCCDICDIAPKKTPCHSGAGPCERGVCDGKSANCPFNATVSDGKLCKKSPEPLVCKNMKCDQGLCEGSGLKPCTCAQKSGKECVYCCLKDGECKAAGSDLKLVKKDYPLVNGTKCPEGSCVDGKCVVKPRKRQTLDRFPMSVDGVVTNLTAPYSLPSLILVMMALHFVKRCFI